MATQHTPCIFKEANGEKRLNAIEVGMARGDTRFEFIAQELAEIKKTQHTILERQDKDRSQVSYLKGQVVTWAAIISGAVSLLVAAGASLIAPYIGKGK